MTKEELIDLFFSEYCDGICFDDLQAFAKLVAEKAFQDGYSIGEAAGFKQAIKLERARGEA